ncbi:MAG: histone deacetylase [Acidimicrobiia bacterium]|nr:histone deacetylase [Acidimicrobiia bacterium]
MRLAVVTHEVFLAHDTGSGHPERPDRLAAAHAGLELSQAQLIPIEAPPIDDVELRRVHSPDYIEAIRRFCASGGGAIDADTVVVGESWEASLRAAGAGLAAIETVAAGAADAAFCAVRPPGHHATPSRAMGFCIFNNIAIAARHLADAGERVVILDVDVHHGNGTQKMFDTHRDVLYLSLHEFPAYPGTGWIDESGTGGGEGSVINVPLPANSAGDVYHEAIERVIVPVVAEAEPDWVLVSAGYDAHDNDPLADLRLLGGDYGRAIGAVAAAVPDPRWVFFLEGGYDLEAIAGSVAATVDGLAGLPVDGRRLATSPSHPAWRMVDQVAQRAATWWSGIG